MIQFVAKDAGCIVWLSVVGRPHVHYYLVSKGKGVDTNP